MNPNELAQKATQLQNEFKNKGKHISISEAVARVSGKYAQSFEQNIADMATEVACFAEQEGRSIQFSEAVNQVFEENPEIKGIVLAEDIKTLDKLKTVILSLRVHKGKAFDLQRQEILNAFDRFRKRTDKDEEVQGLLRKIEDIITRHEEWIKLRKEIGFPPPPHLAKHPRTITFAENIS